MNASTTLSLPSPRKQLYFLNPPLSSSSGPPKRHYPSAQPRTGISPRTHTNARKHEEAAPSPERPRTSCLLLPPPPWGGPGQAAARRRRPRRQGPPKEEATSGHWALSLRDTGRVGRSGALLPPPRRFSWGSGRRVPAFHETPSPHPGEGGPKQRPRPPDSPVAAEPSSPLCRRLPARPPPVPRHRLSAQGRGRLGQHGSAGRAAASAPDQRRPHSGGGWMAERAERAAAARARGRAPRAPPPADTARAPAAEDGRAERGARPAAPRRRRRRHPSGLSVRVLGRGGGRRWDEGGADPTAERKTACERLRARAAPS